MTVKHSDSTEKIFANIAAVAVEPFTVDNTIYYPPPNGIKIGASFWREYTCDKMCGGCCYAFSLDYTADEFEMLVQKHSLIAGLTARRVKRIDDCPYTIYSVYSRGKWCRFLEYFQATCSIHEENPLSCQLELIKVRQVKDVGYIMKAPFGRAHQMRTIYDKEIRCGWQPMSEKQLLENDIPVLSRLRDWAEYFHIDTHLQRVMEAIMQAHIDKNYQTITVV
jgi:Fe-S-cluster containining protein